MGGKCSKNKINTCVKEKKKQTKCICPNGLVIPGNCDIDNNIFCKKCSSGYGDKEDDEFKYSVDELIKTEYKDNIISDDIGDYVVAENYLKDKNKAHKIGGKYYLYPNKPKNNKCESVLKFKDRKYKLKNIYPKCEDLMKVEDKKKLLLTDIDSVRESWEKLKENITSSDEKNTIDTYFGKNVNNLLIYSECVMNDSEKNKKNLDEIIKTLAKNESIKYKNKKNTFLKNKRLVKFNLDNQIWYDNIFALVKHLIYFGLLLFFLLSIRKKISMRFTTFSIFLILLITSTIIVITNDILNFYKKL